MAAHLGILSGTVVERAKLAAGLAVGRRGGQSGEVHVVLEGGDGGIGVAEGLVALRDRKVRLRHLLLAVRLWPPG